MKNTMKRLLTVLAGVAIGTIFISCEQDSLIEDHNIGQEQLQNEVIPLDEAGSVSSSVSGAGLAESLDLQI